MPIRFHQSGDKCYAQWGSRGAKYYYECGNQNAKERARKKAEKQGKAAYAHGYKG